MYYEQGKLDQAIATYRQALVHEPNFPEAYNNLGNALREASRADEAINCYTMCIQLQLARPPAVTPSGRGMSLMPAVAAQAQSQRLSVAYNNLGGILKMQVCLNLLLSCAAPECCTLLLPGFHTQGMYMLELIFPSSMLTNQVTCTPLPGAITKHMRSDVPQLLISHDKSLTAMK